MPREVPDAVVRRLLHRSPSTGVGAVITAFGLLLSAPFLAVGIAVPPMLFGLVVTGFWPLFGCWILVRSWRKGRARLDVLQHGRVAAGRITGATSEGVTYVFDVDGRRYGGTVEVAGGTDGIAADQPVHVLYLPEAPGDRSEIWPLLG